MSSITSRPGRRPAPMTDGQLQAVRYQYNRTLGENADTLRRAKLMEFEKRRAAFVTLGYSPTQASELALRPAKFKMIDADGMAWEHTDKAYLVGWIAERNRALRARAKAAARPSLPAWRSDAVVETKEIRPGSFGPRTTAPDRLRAMELADDDAYWGDDD